MDDNLLEAHVERFNRGVRSGDFEPMLAAFAPDAEMVFEGVQAGPFLGRDAIAAAYAAQPPTDEVRLIGSVRLEDGVIVGDYAWATKDATCRTDAAHCGRRGHHPVGRDVRTVTSRGGRGREVSR